MESAGLKKRIFLLTDGAVSSPSLTIEQARQHNAQIRVFSFGLGSGCDTNLVTSVARAGRGTYTLVRDNDPNLNGLVIRALQNAMEPSLFDTSYGFGPELMSAPEEIYRNTLIFATKLMSREEFSALEFFFKTKSEDTREALDLHFTRADFQ